MKLKISTIAQLSLIKTIYFNLKYFGIQGLHFPVLISKNVILRLTGGGIYIESYRFGNVRIGFDSIGIYDGTQRAVLQIYGYFYMGEGVRISKGVKICCGQNAKLLINRNTTININSQIICMNNVSLGENVMVSWDNLIMDSDFHQITKNSIQNPISQPIEIGDGVWIGCRSIVLKGSTIPEGSIVAANCTITGKYSEAHILIAGNKILSREVYWKR